MSFDFAELYTASVRQLLPSLLRRRLSYSFDYRGPSLAVPEDPVPVQCALQRLLCGVHDLVEGGFLIFDACAEPATAGRARISLKLAGTGHLAAEDRVDEVLARLHLDGHAAEPAAAEPAVRRAHARCPNSGGLVRFACQRSAGLLFTLDLLLPATELQVQLPQDGMPGRAWVIDADTLTAEALVRRLQRDGWATTRYSDLQQAAMRLDAAPPATARPSLVLACESAGIGLAGAIELASTLPHWSQFIYAAAPGSPAFAGAHELPGLVLLPLPLGPAALAGLRSRLSPLRDAACGLTRPVPLTQADRPRLLVVDDNEVNRIVATGLAEALGFEVRCAVDGADAVEQCGEHVPDVVLMDLHMPRLDGLESTVRIRALQSRGELAPCLIVALTADANMSGACKAAGMDGFLGKPLLLDALRSELRRLCAPMPGSRLQTRAARETGSGTVDR